MQHSIKHSFRNTFAPPLAAMLIIITLLLAKWAGAQEPAGSPTYRLPGSCVVTTTLVTRGGIQQIVKHYSCEYTQTQLNRMAREGR